MSEPTEDQTVDVSLQGPNVDFSATLERTMLWVIAVVALVLSIIGLFI